MPAQPDLQWMMSMPKATPSQPLTPAQTRALRALGHRLRPVVTVSERGLTEGVSAELERALEDHELIKVRLALGDPGSRRELATRLCRQHSAQLVQQIGKVILILRPARQPDPRLSNLHRLADGPGEPRP